jgi:type I restriction enzyme S subunit
MIKKTIGDLCRILNGYAFKSSHYVENGVRIIRIANVQKGYIDFSDKAFYPSDLSFIKNYMLKEGDILMSLTGNVGRVALLTADLLPAALNQRVACLRLKDESIYKKFLFHYLNSSSFENRCIRESKGVAQKNMSTEWLKKQKIPCFEMVKQKEISKVLDNITNIINKKQQQISKYDELIYSQFVVFFGDIFNGESKYPTVKISEVVSDKIVRSNKVFGENDEIRYLDISSIDNKKNKISGYTKYIKKNAPSRAQQHIHKDDIIISTVRPKLNNVSKVQDNFSNIIASTGFCVLRASKINADYLFTLVSMQSFADYLDTITTGANYPAVSNKDILNFAIPFPPNDEQIKFSNLIKKVDILKIAIQQSLIQTQQLFDSLMQEYFG